jgi:hypothetical protein
MPEPQGVPGDAEPEEIEEKLLWDFRQLGASGGTVSPETAQALIKLIDDAGKGQPPDPEKEKERAEAKEKARAEAQRKGEEEDKARAAEAKKAEDDA